jgi:hypothetical protein
MATATHPTKEQVRAWQQERLTNPKPLPSQEEIRRQLGWGLMHISGR